MILINELRKTVSFLNKNLKGAGLDYFKVRKSVVELCFLQSEGGNLNEVWLSGTDKLEVFGHENNNGQKACKLALLKKLIGDAIEKVDIRSNGTLIIYFSKYALSVSFEEDSLLEEIWSITPDNAAPYFNHSWSASLTDDCKVVLFIEKN